MVSNFSFTHDWDFGEINSSPAFRAQVKFHRTILACVVMQSHMLCTMVLEVSYYFSF